LAGIVDPDLLQSVEEPCVVTGEVGRIGVCGRGEADRGASAECRE
jgi:hypothetical protein